jgi:phosphoglycerate dehydrogenase-like enzyme
MPKVAPPPAFRARIERVFRMVRAAILDDYQNVAMGLAGWSPIAKDVEVKVFNKPFAGQDEAIKALQGFAIIVGMRERTPFPRKMIEALPDLKLLITTGARNNSFDIKACAERGITVCGTGSVGSPTTGIAFGLMLELTRRIGFENARLKAGEAWQVTIGRDLEGLTLGILGLGRLGQRSATVGKAFGMNTIAWSQNLTAEKAQAAGAQLVSKEDLFRNADIVTIHLVLSDRSRGLVGAKELGLMKKTSYLINTSRGPIVDERSLIAALQAKSIAGAGLDVHRAIAARSSISQARQRRDHATPRLCQRAELPEILPRHRGGHSRLA